MLPELEIWELKLVAYLSLFFFFFFFGSTEKENVCEGLFLNAHFCYTRGMCVAQPDLCAARKEWHCASLVLLACMLTCTQHPVTIKDRIMMASFFSFFFFFQV